jgi:hypothetical protein
MHTVIELKSSKNSIFNMYFKVAALFKCRSVSVKKMIDGN